MKQENLKFFNLVAKNSFKLNTSKQKIVSISEYSNGVQILINSSQTYQVDFYFNYINEFQLEKLTLYENDKKREIPVENASNILISKIPILLKKY